jgi:ABC-type polysaccharide transport system permease subunit
MAEIGRNSGGAIQMARASSLVLDPVDFTPPFAEGAFAKNTISKLALEIQETEFRFLKPLWINVVFQKLHYLLGKLWAQTIMLVPQFRVGH